MAKLAGSIWIEGDDLHYVDQFNREWYYPVAGIKAANAGAQPGSIWVDNTNQYLYYIHEWGVYVCTPQYPYADAIVPISAAIGSMWIGQDNQLHWAGIPWPSDPANYRYNVRAHVDTAAHTDNTNAHQDTHTDAHQDGAHVDTPHYDVAHTDHNDTTHTDAHTDVAHNDHTDTAHTDSPAVNFGDHVDCHSQYVSYTDPLYNHHLDCNSTRFSGSDPNPYGLQHSDNWFSDSLWVGAGGGDAGHDVWTNHWDFAHTDTHTDVPHQDNPKVTIHTDHWDTKPHIDGAHSDIAHTDAAHVDAHQDAHTDAHQDSHGDTPHTDYPILIGP